MHFVKFLCNSDIYVTVSGSTKHKNLWTVISHSDSHDVARYFLLCGPRNEQCNTNTRVESRLFGHSSSACTLVKQTGHTAIFWKVQTDPQCETELILSAVGHLLTSYSKFSVVVCLYYKCSFFRISLLEFQHLTLSYGPILSTWNVFLAFSFFHEM